MTPPQNDPPSQPPTPPAGASESTGTAPLPKSAAQGWLALFGVGCLVGGVMSLTSLSEWSSISDSEWQALVSVVPVANGLKSFTYVHAILAAAGLFWLLFLLVKPRPSTPLWAVTVLSVLLILGIATWIWLEAFTSQLTAFLQARGQPMPVEPGWRSEVLRGVAGPVIWIWYFFRSKRVKNTFGEVTPQRVWNWLRPPRPA